MKKVELKIKSPDVEKGGELLKFLSPHFENSGLKIVAAEEEIVTGMIGSEIIISILISVGSSVLANQLDIIIKNLLRKAKTSTNINFEAENINYQV